MATKTKKITAAKTATKKAPKAKKEAAPKAKKEASPKEPKAKKAPKVKATKEPKAFAHDERVLPFVGKLLTHTERDGKVHECEVHVDGFYVNGERYNSATAAAKPLQPVDPATGRTRAVNGLVYWNIVKTPRAAITPEAALESATKASDRAIEKCATAIEAAGDGKKNDVRRLIQGAVKKLEKLLEVAA